MEIPPPVTPRPFEWSGPPSIDSAGLDPLSVWSVDLARVPADDSAALALLSADERVRHERFRQVDDRRRFLWGRATLRYLLGPTLGQPPAAVRFAFNDHGKPSLESANAGGPPLHFNVAHSGRLIVLAFHRFAPVGIDVEHVRDDFDWGPVACRFFGAGRTQRWQALDPVAARRQFFRAWTRREAELKAIGIGLADAAPAGDSIDLDARPLSLPSGYEGAVCVSNRSHLARSARGAARAIG